MRISDWSSDVCSSDLESNSRRARMTRFTVNNQPVEYRMAPETPLLWALRDASNLTGAKYGCGTGDCGACTVDIDGAAVRACQVTIGESEGAFVPPIHGLARERDHPHPPPFPPPTVPHT